MKYPDNKQLKHRQESLLRTVRLYIRGHQTISMLKNEIQCLFADLSIEANNENKDIVKSYLNFEKEFSEVIK